MPASYTQHGLTLSKEQKKKLARGEVVRLTNAKLQGNDIVHLTATQLRKVQTAIAKGTGTDMHFSNAQIKYMMKHGSGFLDFLGGIADIIKPAAGTFLNALAPAAANAVIRKVGGSQQPTMSWVATDQVKKGARAVKGTAGSGLYLPGSR